LGTEGEWGDDFAEGFADRFGDDVAVGVRRDADQVRRVRFYPENDGDLLEGDQLAQLRRPADL
jgi:hypothetical protein